MNSHQYARLFKLSYYEEVIISYFFEDEETGSFLIEFISLTKVT